MKQTFDVAIVGATGLVGRMVLDVLIEREFPIRNLYLIASERSTGETLMFRGKAVSVISLPTFDFKTAQIAWFCAGSSVAAEYAPIAAAARCLVIDNSSYFRYEESVPLVVPEVNGHVLAEPLKQFIIANPNCSTAQMVLALKPIHDAARITRVNVATYQSVSGSGQAGLSELEQQIAADFTQEPKHKKTYSVQIAFNVIPKIDEFQSNGYTREEMKMVWETRKILGDETIQVNPTAVRVPVRIGHSEAVHLETEKKLTAAQARNLLNEAPGVTVLPEGELPNPLEHGMGTDDVYVGRIREDISHPHGLNFWLVADNIRKGAALNAVQIAEYCIKQSWFHRD